MILRTLIVALTLTMSLLATPNPNTTSCCCGPKGATGPQGLRALKELQGKLAHPEVL